MAASIFVPQDCTSRKSPIGRRGVLTLTGFGIKIRMQAGHLEIQDGIGPERRTIRLARIGHNLKRLVCISEDGFATLAALKWISDVGASFVMLNFLARKCLQRARFQRITQIPIVVLNALFKLPDDLNVFPLIPDFPVRTTCLPFARAWPR